MIVRYSSGHIFRYPHPELLSPIVKFVIFTDLFHFILFSPSRNLAFHSSLNLHPPPVLRWVSGGGAVTGGDSESVSSARSACSTSAHSCYSHMRIQVNPCELLVDLWHISGVLPLPLDRREYSVSWAPYSSPRCKDHSESPTPSYC